MRLFTVICGVASIGLSGGQGGFAQTSVGFEDPADLTALTTYRLPDWGYRTWDLGFDLSGRGYDGHGAHPQVSGGVHLGLNSAWVVDHQGEDRTWRLDLNGDLDYSRSRYGNAETSSSYRFFSGEGGIQADWRAYPGKGDLSYGLEGRYERDYSEWKGDRSLVLDPPVTDIQRTGDGRVAATLGIGRLRDITPLIRAARLSERLEALGRPGLAPDRIRLVAEALARESGYRMVFDRQDRQLWRDVLEPALEGQEPLDPYEIMYLSEILAEDLGFRREGWQVLVGAFFQETRRSLGDATSSNVFKGPYLRMAWSRNLSLHHQLRLDAILDHGLARGAYFDQDRTSGRIAAEHLWNVSDRYLLTSDVALNGIYLESEGPLSDLVITRLAYSTLSSDLRVRLEDSLAMTARVRGSYQVDRGGDPRSYSHAWSWDYVLAFDYVLDRFLY